MRVDLQRAGTGGVTLDLEERPERLRPRPVRRRSARLPATAPHHVSIECGGPASELLGQPSLSDTRFASQQHDAAPARHGVVQSPQHHVELAVAANEEARAGLVSAAGAIPRGRLALPIASTSAAPATDLPRASRTLRARCLATGPASRPCSQADEGAASKRAEQVQVNSGLRLRVDVDPPRRADVRQISHEALLTRDLRRAADQPPADLPSTSRVETV